MQVCCCFAGLGQRLGRPWPRLGEIRRQRCLDGGRGRRAAGVLVEEEEEDEDEDTRTRTTSAVGHGGEEKKVFP